MKCEFCNHVYREEQDARADERRAIRRALLRDRTLFPAEREPLVRILTRRDEKAKKEVGR